MQSSSESSFVSGSSESNPKEETGETMEPTEDPPPPQAATQNNELRFVAMTIYLCHGGICELIIRCPTPQKSDIQF